MKPRESRASAGESGCNQSEHAMNTQLRVEHLYKVFVLHNQHGAALPVLHDANFEVKAGECVVLDGHSGSGKSTLLRSLYANYQPNSGHIWVKHHHHWVDLVNAPSRQILAIRRDTIGWVSQFLRVIPRVSTLDVVIQPLLERGLARAECEERARKLLARLNVPERLWSLPPSTFSGGEQQRVNIARGFIANYPILLLDEPTASLDSGNSNVVVQLIEEAREGGAAIVGIFHDSAVRNRLATHLHAMQPYPGVQQHDYQ